MVTIVETCNGDKLGTEKPVWNYLCAQARHFVAGGEMDMLEMTSS